MPQDDESNVTHPQFVVKSSKPVRDQQRGLLFITNQKTYDAIMAQVGQGRFASPQAVLEEAIEKLLGLPEGSADPIGL